MTITQTIDIPADRRITLEVPREIPTGSTARYELVWVPLNKTTNNLNTTLEKIQNLCRNSSITVDNFKEMRRNDNELEEKQYKRLFSGDTN